MTATTAPTLSRRQKTAGANHHLWNNHGTWWFHGTVHLPDGTAERVRVNLKTDDLSKARSRRDSILGDRCFQSTRTLAPRADPEPRQKLALQRRSRIAPSLPPHLSHTFLHH